MKRLILVFFLSGMTTCLVAQSSKPLHTSVDDNGRQLVIKVNGFMEGKRVDYDHTFEVEGLSKSERAQITREVFDSLGLKQPKVPVAPVAPKTPEVLSGGHSVHMEKAEEEMAAPENRGVTKDKKAYSKTVSQDSNTGEMFLRYQFMRGGDEFIYEKTVAARGKSAKQLKQIMLDFEREIDLPQQVTM